VAEPHWIDLLDPDEATIGARAPVELHPTAVARLARRDGLPRPSIEGHDTYVLVVLLAAVAVPEEYRVFYQEIDLVVTAEQLLVIRKTPTGEHPFDPTDAVAACPPGERPAKQAQFVVDTVAERYLDLMDAMNDEIDELEEHVDDWPAAQIRARLSELRHDILQIRRTLAPTRDAVHTIVDGRLEREAPGIFTREVALHYADVYDKLLRASDELELSRDLLASVRDYHQAQIANSQNDVMKRLTAIASILLLPTFIVGLYGQNFGHIPELGWGFGYWWSWGWIVATTIGQVVFFRRKGWL
jgi:magnesium transporter